MESCLNNSFPPNTQKDFFSEGKKINPSGVSTIEAFLRKSKQFKSHSNRSEKYSEKNEVHKKEIDNCHSAMILHELKNQPPEGVLQSSFSAKFEKISRKTYVLEYYF